MKERRRRRQKEDEKQELEFAEGFRRINYNVEKGTSGELEKNYLVIIGN